MSWQTPGWQTAQRSLILGPFRATCIAGSNRLVAVVGRVIQACVPPHSKIAKSATSSIPVEETDRPDMPRCSSRQLPPLE